MAQSPQERLTGAQKAAMLLMALDEEQAAAVLSRMSEAAVAKLKEAARTLREMRPGDEEKREALRGFLVRQLKGGFFVGDAEERFRRVLARAKGEEALRRFYAEEPAAEKQGALPEADPLEVIENAPDEQVAGLLAGESPRCAAVLLSRLSGRKAGRVLGLLEDAQRQPIVQWIMTNQGVPPEVADEVVRGFKDKLEAATVAGAAASEERRAQELAKLIGALDRESQDKVLSELHERDPQLADLVEKAMFGFQDLLKVEPKSMQALLRQVEVEKVALALKGAPAELEEFFYANMSQRARERVQEERELIGRVPLSQVEEAREELMRVARQMYRKGELVVQIGEEQYVE